MYQDASITEPSWDRTSDGDQRRLVKAPHIAAFLGLPISTLYDRARSEPPQIPGVVRIGRLIRFDLTAVEAWVAAGGDRNTSADANEQGE